MNQHLAVAEQELRALGLTYWANKLADIDHSGKDPVIKAVAVLKLYGGFGSLSDNAFSDSDAPLGMTGQEATAAYFKAINSLYSVAQQCAQADGEVPPI